jgi:hypothetical protein
LEELFPIALRLKSKIFYAAKETFWFLPISLLLLYHRPTLLCVLLLGELHSVLWILCLSSLMDVCFVTLSGQFVFCTSTPLPILKPNSLSWCNHCFLYFIWYDMLVQYDYAGKGVKGGLLSREEEPDQKIWGNCWWDVSCKSLIQICRQSWESHYSSNGSDA